MLYIFKNRIWFVFLFFTQVVIDILVKINVSGFSYRYLSKPPILLFLLGYYYVNNNEKVKKNKIWMYTSLSLFFIGDLAMILHDKFIFLFFSISIFSLAKVFLCFRFNPKHDFNISRLFPLSIFMFFYLIVIVNVVYENLGSLLIPSIMSFFLTLLLFQFAFLRQSAFNRSSYLSLLIGVILYILSESIMAIEVFKIEFPFNTVLIPLLYYSALLLIVKGSISEVEDVDKNYTNFY